jgi:hypothetical protein
MAGVECIFHMGMFESGWGNIFAMITMLCVECEVSRVSKKSGDGHGGT